MKTDPARLFPLLATALFFVAFARADDAAYTQIIKRRDAVLSQILAGRESRYAIGATDEESVWSARLALWSFRRDITTSATEKIRQQELIVSALEKRLATVDAQLKTGASGPETVLLATDSLLQAQQLLAELRPLLKKN